MLIRIGVRDISVEGTLLQYVMLPTLFWAHVDLGVQLEDDSDSDILRPHLLYFCTINLQQQHAHLLSLLILHNTSLRSLLLFQPITIIICHHVLALATYIHNRILSFPAHPSLTYKKKKEKLYLHFGQRCDVVESC